MAQPVVRVDVVILGAGLSGICAGYNIGTRNPDLTYLILERRADLGGTWDLFRYPGIRSDSDMYTFGFSFYPWKSAKPIAPRKDIQDYIRSTADKFGILPRIRFGTHVRKARWTTGDATWRLEAEDGLRVECNFLFGCTGYYSYEMPHRPTFPGEGRFRGRIVHPQFWKPGDDDKYYQGKRVAIIGSGATAVTLLPSLVDGGAAHVTMVQRTPTYILPAPEKDAVAGALQSVLPAAWSHPLLRHKNAAIHLLSYNVFNKLAPERAKRWILNLAWKQLRMPDGGRAMSREEFDKHFTPPYKPWDQR